MASGRYTRVDGGSSSSNYCSTVTLVVFAALCFAGVWMMTSSSVIPVQNVKSSSKDDKNGVREEVIESTDTKQQFGDFPGYSATKGDNNMNVTEPEHRSYDREIPNNPEESIQNAKDGTQEKKALDENFRKGNHSEDAPETKMENGETKYGEQLESQDGSISNLPDSNESGKKSLNQEELERSSDVEDEGAGSKKPGQDELLPSMAQSELLNETTVQNGSWLSQAAESDNEKSVQQYSDSKEQGGHVWKLCNITVGPDYIPCLDNILAIKKLRSRKHYEHRERHCPEVAPSCLVSLPEGYRRPIKWPVSRDKIWFHNVPHTQLVGYKGQQNWLKLSGEYLSFPGGGTQFPHGARHYIEFIEEIAPDVRWGTRSRLALDVGCGVASFGGYLFDKDVLTMSFAPKDEHEAQVQFALERGIPAISAVMGSKRLPFSSMVFDVLHCARCRVPWHVEGGKLLLELNRLLRPGGFFVWSATPLYRKSDEDLKIRNAMEELTKSLCWELVAFKMDKINRKGVAVYRRPTSNDCFRNRSQTKPPFCQPSDDPNAAWDVPLQSCVHKVPEGAAERGSQWPEQWPARLEKPPYWLSSSQVGVYGKPTPEDFTSDYEHWKRVVRNSYLNGMGFSWSSVRNVMDMRAVYGGFAAALRDLNVWVMNVVSVDAPDTLPVIYERGLFGIYHNWCESFSTYPRSYDLLHANHLFSKIKKKCDLVALVVEVDRILRPEGWLVVRDTIEMMSELEGLLRSMQWEIRLTYSKDNESLMSARKGWWRPTEVETIK